MDPTTTTTSTEDARRAIEDRGVTRHVAEQLAQQSTPDLIGAWASYGERHPRMGPGALVNAIRAGHMPPERHRPRQGRPDEDRVPRWLRDKLPEVCDGEGEPHPAAVLAARRIEFRYGRLSAREHSQAIRGAVEDAEAEAAGAPITEPD